MTELAKYQQYLRTHPKLRNLFFELTDCCNLACRHCGSNCDPSHAQFLDTELLLKTIDEIALDFGNLGYMICVTGGEPLLHPEFEHIIKRIISYDIPWGMTTNTTLIDSAMARKLGEMEIGTVSVSLDGLKENHEWLRRVPGCFEKALEGIKLMKAEDIYVQVTTTVNKRNLNELEDIYKLVKDLGVDSWRMSCVDPIGRAQGNEELLLSKEEMFSLLDFVRVKRFDKSNTLDVCFGCSHYFSYEYENEIRDFYYQCTSGTQTASILCNGDIYSCLDIERRPELVQGNIKKDRFSDIWYNRFKEFRIDRTQLCDDCRKCDERLFCGGDSAHTWNYGENKPRFCYKKEKNQWD